MGKIQDKIKGAFHKREARSEFDERLDRVDKVLRVAKGRTDIKSKLMLLLNPDKPQTTTFLTKGQARFTAIAHFMAGKWPEFEGLRDYADQIALSALGIQGQGIDASVRLTGALGESKLLQKIGLSVRGPGENQA